MCVNPGGNDHRRCTAAQNSSPCVENVGLMQRIAGIFRCARLFGDGFRFASENGFIDGKPGGFLDGAVCRNAVAGFYTHPISPYQLTGRKRQPGTISANGSRGRRELTEGFQCLFRAEFLHEAKDCIEQDNQQDGNSICHFAQQYRDTGCYQ